MLQGTVEAVAAEHVTVRGDGGELAYATKGLHVVRVGDRVHVRDWRIVRVMAPETGPGR